jgi:CO/xanthine dehydrogenase Mo-binding subunit
MELLERRDVQEGYVGKSIPRIVDGFEKVTGSARYISDLELPGMLYGVILHSEVPHGFIEELDYSQLLDSDHIRAVITGRGAASRNIGPLKDQPPLKFPKVRSLADEVLAVATTDPDRATALLERVRIRYRELRPLLTPDDALSPGAPLIHEETGSNLIRVNFDTSAGDIERAFAGAHLVREDSYEVPRVAFAPMGTLGALSYIDESGALVLISNTQEPYQLKRELSEVLGLPAAKVRISQPYIGGTFGRGMDIYSFEVITCLLTLKTGRPVKTLYTRTEDFRYSPTRQPARIRVKSAVSKDGKLLARDVETTLDAGAYVSWGLYDARVMAQAVTGLYALPAVRFRARGVYTNNLYTINMRGAGNPQMTFALESHMDSIADELGLDPLEFRLANAYEGNYTTPQHMKVKNARLRSALKRSAELIGWRGPHAIPPSGSKRYGIGFAALFHVGGGARVYKTDGAGAIVKIDDFGVVTLYTGMSELGQGTVNSLAQIVATELGIGIDKVRVEYKGDADSRVWDTATHASRSTFVSGNAAILAVKKLKSQLIRTASKLSGKPVTELTIKGGQVISGDHKFEIPLDRLVRRAHFTRGGKVFMAHAYYDPETEMLDQENKGDISAAYVNAAQAALVEVDQETGEVRVLKVASVHDIGQPINPALAAGQIVGGLVQGLGHALLEELMLESGGVTNPTFADYPLPGADQVPAATVEFLDTKDREGPFGAKGVAENGIIPVAAAIANAVHDATGVRVNTLPITREKLFVAIRKGV